MGCERALKCKNQLLGLSSAIFFSAAVFEVNMRFNYMACPNFTEHNFTCDVSVKLACS